MTYTLYKNGRIWTCHSSIYKACMEISTANSSHCSGRSLYSFKINIALRQTGQVDKQLSFNFPIRVSNIGLVGNKMLLQSTNLCINKNHTYIETFISAVNKCLRYLFKHHITLKMMVQCKYFHTNIGRGIPLVKRHIPIFNRIKLQ